MSITHRFLAKALPAAGLCFYHADVLPLHDLRRRQRAHAASNAPNFAGASTAPQRHHRLLLASSPALSRVTAPDWAVARAMLSVARPRPTTNRSVTVAEQTASAANVPLPQADAAERASWLAEQTASAAGVPLPRADAAERAGCLAEQLGAVLKRGRQAVAAPAPPVPLPRPAASPRQVRFAPAVISARSEAGPVRSPAADGLSAMAAKSRAARAFDAVRAPLVAAACCVAVAFAAALGYFTKTLRGLGATFASAAEALGVLFARLYPVFCAQRSGAREGLADLGRRA